MSYLRVIPRDFFNEAKLLKCLGRLQLAILDNEIRGLDVDYDGKAFDIRQNMYDGSIYCANYAVKKDGSIIHLYTPLNSRENWPLMGVYRGEEYYIYRDNGEFMPSILTKGEANERL